MEIFTVSVFIANSPHSVGLNFKEQKSAAMAYEKLKEIGEGVVEIIDDFGATTTVLAENVSVLRMVSISDELRRNTEIQKEQQYYAARAANQIKTASAMGGGGVILANG